MRRLGLALLMALAACGPDGHATRSLHRNALNYDIEVYVDSAGKNTCYLYPNYGISCVPTTK